LTLAPPGQLEHSQTRSEDVRELTYGRSKHKHKHGILFTIRQDAVAILYIHHTAREELES
jgi:hypothetical protein